MVSKRYRSAVTGELVTKEYADANPDTTVAETIDEVEIDEVDDGAPATRAEVTDPLSVPEADSRDEHEESL